MDWVLSRPVSIWHPPPADRGGIWWRHNFPSHFLPLILSWSASLQGPSSEKQTLLFREADRNLGEMLTTSFESSLIQRYSPKQNQNLLVNPSPLHLWWKNLFGLPMPARWELFPSLPSVMYGCCAGQISLTSSTAGIWGLHFSFPKERQNLPSISASFEPLQTNWQRKISLLGTYFTSCKGWNRPSAEIAKKIKPCHPSISANSLKHYQRSPTVGSYRPQRPRLTQCEIKLRGFNAAGRNWMSGFPPRGCTTNAVANSRRDGHPPARTEPLPWAKGWQVQCCTSPSKLQVADALEECDLFPPSEMFLALCVLLLIEEFSFQPPAGDRFRHVHRRTACYASQNRLS